MERLSSGDCATVSFHRDAELEGVSRPTKEDKTVPALWDSRAAACRVDVDVERSMGALSVLLEIGKERRLAPFHPRR